MITIEVNNRKVEARERETILSALKRAGVNIPTLCHMDGLTPTGACRLCVVEVEGQRNLTPSCAFPVSDGMKIKTHSPKVMRARKTIVELLLATHPDDCLYCERNGHCLLQNLAEELGVRQRRYVGEKNSYKVDISNPSIVRDPEKCILCGKCVRMCEEIQGVAAIDFIKRGSQTFVGTVFDQGLNLSTCINCGQCVMVCPTGALREQSHIKKVTDALVHPEKFVVVQHAPSVSVTLAEEFGLRPGVDVAGAMTAALRRIGFDRVFDTSFAADLTVMEEASELAHRIKTGGKLPLMTSCSPGWVKFVEQFYPDFLDNLSTCKSPQQMLGAVIKKVFAEREGISPEDIFSVSIMPCTAKKFEAERPELCPNGLPDVDAVLTTRELARMLRARGLNVGNMQPELADSPFKERSTAGKLFGVSGGVAEAAIRTAYYLLTGKESEQVEVKAVRGLEGIKEARMKIGDLDLGVAVVSGLGNARKLLDSIRAGRSDIQFIEVMTCPGGCIGGGGQPYDVDQTVIRKRMQALYDIDRDERLRVSHQNEDIVKLYADYLGEPMSEKSHHLLHTHYAPRALDGE
jgi:iron-only hydrogenase group A